MAACTSLTGSSVTSTTVTTYAPLTGIEVDANGLFERQGCGHGPSLAFKYVATVYTAFGVGGPLEGQPKPAQDGGIPTPIAMSLNDCFADAVFQNLNLSAALGGSDTYAVQIDVFDDVTYNKWACSVGMAITADVAAGEGEPEAGACPDPGSYIPPLDSIANWTAICVARQQSNVQSLAACSPLVATGN